nr:MAG TPA: hypothetical protein [Caudoviricetes sp.]
MSIRPEKLKQYLALKDTSDLAKRFAASVSSTDPQSDSTHASVALEMPHPAALDGMAKSVFSALCSFSDSIYMAAGETTIRFTFAVENMQKEE